MAKIENTTVYPTVTPAASDLLIGTDVNDNNKTVTFLVSDLTGAGGVAQDLQSVLNTGNTAIQNINLTGNIVVSGTVQPTTITATNGIGTAGQVLSSTGTGLQWVASGAAATPSWNDTLIVGSTATTASTVSSTSMTFTGVGADLVIAASATLTGVGESTFTGNVNINSTDLIFNTTGQISAGGSTGTVGQWLVSTGTGLEWSSSVPAAACCPLQSTLNAGNSTTLGITFTGTGTTSFSSGNSIVSLGANTFSGNNTFSATGNTTTTAGINITGTVSDGTTIGTAGQVLSSTGTGVSWITPASTTNTLQQVLDAGNTATGTNALISITGSLTAGTILDTSLSPGGVGQVLTSTGTGLSWLNLACCSLDNTLSIGNTSAQSILLTGTSTLTVPTVIPASIQDTGGSTGANGQVLGISAGVLSWVTPGVTDTTYTYDVPSGTTSLRLLDSNAAAQDINLTATSPGITITRNSSSQLTFANTGTTSLAAYPSLVNTTSITEGCLISNTSGGVSGITLLRYGGGANTGIVPTGGTNTTFLRGDGTWQIVGGIQTVSSVANSGLTTPLAATIVGNNLTLQPNRFTGGANEGFVPSSFGQGQTTDFLRADGTWHAPSGGSGGVTTLALTTTSGLTSPVSGSIVGATLTLNSNVFGGSNLVGYVPDSSASAQTTTFLRADGSWGAPVGSGGVVQSVNSSGTTGLTTPIYSNIAGSQLNILINEFGGSNQVGHVPSSAASSQTTTFLRADGTWKVPAAEAGGYIERFTFSAQNTNFNQSFGFHSFGNVLQNGFNSLRADTLVLVGSPNAPSNWTDIEKIGGTVFSNDFTGVGSCAAGAEGSTVCSAHITGYSSVELSLTFDLYKVDVCQGEVPSVVGTVTVEAVQGKFCADFTAVGGAALNIDLSGTQGLIFVCSGDNASVSIQGYVSMHIIPFAT